MPAFRPPTPVSSIPHAIFFLETFPGKTSAAGDGKAPAILPEASASSRSRGIERAPRGPTTRTTWRARSGGREDAVFPPPGGAGEGEELRPPGAIALLVTIAGGERTRGRAPPPAAEEAGENEPRRRTHTSRGARVRRRSCRRAGERGLRRSPPRHLACTAVGGELLGVVPHRARELDSAVGRHSSSSSIAPQAGEGRTEQGRRARPRAQIRRARPRAQIRR
jgi:hypothetical protein